MGRKKRPTVGVFPTVSVFSYGQINPTVKMPRLTCTQFVVPHFFTELIFPVLRIQTKLFLLLTTFHLMFNFLLKFQIIKFLSIVWSCFSIDIPTVIHSFKNIFFCYTFCFSVFLYFSFSVQFSLSLSHTHTVFLSPSFLKSKFFFVA